LPLLTTTPTAGVSDAKAIANLQYITNQGYAPLASPVFTGNPTYGGNTLATVNQIPSLAGYAPLASPALTGSPTAPTPTVGSPTDQIANIGFVNAQIALIPSGALIQSGQINNCSISGSMGSALSGYLQNDYVCRSQYTVNLSALGLPTYSSNTAYVATACFSNINFTLADGYMQMLYGMWITVNTTSGSNFTITVYAPLHVNNPANTVNGTPTFNLIWTTAPRLSTQ
jgi:hypothetical protein